MSNAALLIMYLYLTVAMHDLFSCRLSSSLFKMFQRLLNLFFVENEESLSLNYIFIIMFKHT